MMFRNRKIEILPACIIMFLFMASLLSGCSGCSKSGLIREKYDNKAAPADSSDHSQVQTQEPDSISGKAGTDKNF